MIPPPPLANVRERVSDARFTQRLKAQPDYVDGWSMGARPHTVLGKLREAADGFKRVVHLRPRDAQTLADGADALAMLDNRSLEGEAEKLIMQAVKLDPTNVRALSLVLLRQQVGELASLSAPMAVGASGVRVEIGGNARR